MSLYAYMEERDWLRESRNWPRCGCLCDCGWRGFRDSCDERRYFGSSAASYYGPEPGYTVALCPACGSSDLAFGRFLEPLRLVRRYAMKHNPIHLGGAA